MADTDEQILEDARQRGETLTPEELLVVIERRHVTNSPGVKRETIDAYDEAAAADADIPLAEDQLNSEIEDNITDSETWVGPDTYYALGEDRVSAFPPEWHDALEGADDLRVYVDTIEEAMADDTNADASRGGMGVGVPERLLLNAVAAIGGVGRETAKDQLERHRDEDQLVQDADQHPDARVYLSEEADEMRSGWINN